MKIQYRFRLKDGEESSFALRLDPKTLSLIPQTQDVPPQWTLLGNQKCPHCPLSEAEHPHCPVARNLAGIIQEFRNHISFEEGDVSIVTDEREYRRRAPLQTAVGSLIGIIMVTSGCPHMDKLRPMVYTHLPFASSEETTYRAISMYLLAQYFRYRRGRQPDWDLAGLVSIYEAVGQVNRHFVQRLKTIAMADANLNAIVKLDCFATIAATRIVGQALQGMEALFQPYLGGD